MASQKSFFVMGLLFSVIFATRLILSVMTDNLSMVELLNWGTLAYMSFAIGHLYPQFKQKDERVNAIRQKGMYRSIFVVIVVLIILMVLVQFNMLMLTTLEVIRTMISITFITIWTSWIILSKKM